MPASPTSTKSGASPKTIDSHWLHYYTISYDIFDSLYMHNPESSYPLHTMNYDPTMSLLPPVLFDCSSSGHTF
jgi:hypothetical protein